MKKIQIISTVENGNLKRNRKLIRDAICGFEGKTITLTIARKFKERTSPENRYYFGVVVSILQNCINEEWGEVWSKEKCHELLKSKFLFTEKYNEDTGEIIQLPKSTTECTTVEFEEFLEECRRFIKEWFNTDVPLPNEELEIDFK